MKTNLILIGLIISSLTLFYGCNSGSKRGLDMLPKGRGESAEIILLLDSVRWNGQIGDELRTTFNEDVPGLPRSQPMFDLRYIRPFDFKSILRIAKNIIVVISLEDESREGKRLQNYFTSESLDSLRSNPDIFTINKKNLFATDQNVLFLIGKDDKTLKQKIIDNRQSIRNHINRIEEKRIAQALYKGKEEKMIEKTISNKYQFSLRVPYGYKIASSNDEFVWLRLMGQRIDRNIFVSFKEYSNQDLFNDEEIINWRNEICEKYIFGDPEKPDTYVTTELRDPPIIEEVNFNDHYGKKIKGRWKTNSIFMGGPFIGYVLVDEKLNRMYYIEGFVYSPGVEQRELIRELSVILKTFRPNDEIS